MYLSFKTNNEVWAKLFKTLAPVRMLEFYRNKYRPVQLQAISSKHRRFHQMMVALLRAEKIGRQLNEKENELGMLNQS